MQHVANLIRGYLIGAANIIPGVSGGTLALVLGIYERLVHTMRTGAGALATLLRGRLRDGTERLRRVEWPFLIALLIGIAAATVSLAALLERALDDHPQKTAAFFFGLVAASIVVAWRLVRRWGPGPGAAVALVAIAAFFVLGLRSGEVADPPLWAFLGAGVIAAVAMILPGISGSFVLLMIGLYDAVLAAINDRDAAVLAAVVIGAFAGLAVFSTALDELLRRHHDVVMGGLIGLMAGSLRVLWPWPDGPETTTLGAPVDWGIPLLLALGGFAAVLAIGWVAGRTERD
jgi:putative membrane protein